MTAESEVPFRDLLQRDYPEVYDYLKNALKMLQRQQVLLAKLKNSSLMNLKVEKLMPDVKIEIVKDEIIENKPVEIKEEGECSEDEEKSTEQNNFGINRFLLEETTGMYYDQVTGYYYNLDNGLFYDGNKGCYYYFDIIAQKYRLHSQVHPDTEQSNIAKNESCNHLSEIDDSDSDNSEDSGNLVIKEEVVVSEEIEHKTDVENNVSETKCDETKEIVKPEIKVENVNEKSEECISPPSTCEILDKRYLNLIQYTKLLPAPKNIVHKLTPDGSKAKQYAQIRNWYTLKHQLTTIEAEIVQYESYIWERIEQYLCFNKRDDKNSNWKSYKEVKAQLSDTQTKLIKSKVVGWPPCIRVIVTESKSCKQLIGQLFLITCPGGSIGRSTNRDIVIPDDNVSKLHAEISFVGNVNKVGRGHYIIKDKGSTNGTYLNGKKIPRSSSGEPKHLTHGNELVVGDTKLLCHIHDGSETCNLCEPGIQAIILPEESIKSDISQKRKYDEELKSLKEKYGLLGCEPPDAVLPKGYKDRAEKRRKTVGSQNANEKTEVACVSQPIPTKNKGFKLLENMGWTPGKSLGANNSGIKEPIGLDIRDEKMGLGFQTNVAPLAQPNINIAIKPSKIKFNFGSKTNMPIKTNRIHFAKDASSDEEK
ncbi:angiogenic factor with G patch and FHA domains 1 isoform X2 [Daktulosphaira vitifoliae]|uniref:angiogenic factor with G patch and FHA domains 1 isoform X2 n=1 Tax=Daktulosphaira vitifoliae TaxID=58002 RepID=UPI0021AA6481|nr:angiogenic factor with G patch and FHA domains 1 isoform X2 [Daktulosphaira vitifoliae]